MEVSVDGVLMYRESQINPNGNSSLPLFIVFFYGVAVLSCLPIKLLMAELFPCQLRSILVLNLSVLRKNSFWEYFMRINWEKFVEPSIFHTKFRSMALHEIWLLWFPKNFWSLNFGGKGLWYLQGTALIYFKRFYLKWSVMEHHPKDIM